MTQSRLQKAGFFCDMDRRIKVAIQGAEGAFHEIAARNFFAPYGYEVDVVECDTFPRVFEVVQGDSSMLGIMAIENTIAGSLLQNHHLLSNNELTVIGEYKLRIEHNLVALKGQTLADIKEVHSHPIALMQCEDFLSNHKHMKVVESEDTALSAREIAERAILSQAAICSSLAAEMYGLEILASGIETNKHNFTRFLVLAPEQHPFLEVQNRVRNKSSLMFTVQHEEGSLTKILTIFSFYHMNLTKIQSLPVIGREWEYRFYVNLEYKDYKQYQYALNAVMPMVKELKILGEYTSC